MKINDEELEKINGGEAGLWIYLIVTSIIVFASGVLQGYTHGKECGN